MELGTSEKFKMVKLKWAANGGAALRTRLCGGRRREGKIHGDRHSFIGRRWGGIGRPRDPATATGCVGRSARHRGQLGCCLRPERGLLQQDRHLLQILLHVSPENFLSEDPDACRVLSPFFRGVDFSGSPEGFAIPECGRTGEGFTMICSI